MKSSRWNRAKLKAAINKNNNISDTLRSVGLAPHSGNYRTFHKYKELWNLDTDHFIKSKNRPKLEKLPLDKILVEGSWFNRWHLRNRLIEEKILEYVCEKCGISEWNGEHISLHLDHKNGINNDNRLENLRLLCPNCHSQTPTYAGRNTKGPKKSCPDCGKEIAKVSNFCVKCVVKRRSYKTKIEWPPAERLKKMVQEESFVSVAKRLGVSDNAIRKRIAKYG